MSISIFSPPPAGADEEARERAVITSGALDARRDAVLQAICTEVGRLLGASAALLSVLYGETQYVIAAENFTAGAYRRRHSFSGHALAAGQDLFIVPNLLADERFGKNPWINGEVGRYRFYAAALVRSIEGQPVGVLSVLDGRVRHSLTDEESRAMLDAAAQVCARLATLALERNEQGRTATDRQPD